MIPSGWRLIILQQGVWEVAPVSGPCVDFVLIKLHTAWRGPPTATMLFTLHWRTQRKTHNLSFYTKSLNTLRYFEVSSQARFYFGALFMQLLDIILHHVDILEHKHRINIDLCSILIWKLSSGRWVNFVLLSGWLFLCSPICFAAVYSMPARWTFIYNYLMKSFSTWWPC